MPKIIAPGIAALALFDSSMQNEIINTIRSMPEGQLRAQLNRDANIYLPPGVLGMAGPRYAGDPENSYYMLLGLSLVIAKAVKDQNVTPDYWADLFESVFALDETQAKKYGEMVDTVDDAKGVGANLRYGYAALSRLPIIGLLLPDADANTIADDIDAPFEVYQAGKIAHEMLTRSAMSTNRMNAMLRPDLPARIGELVEAMQAAQEGGDIYAVPQLGDLVNKYSPICAPQDERGGFFQDLANFGKKVVSGVGKVLASPAGKVLGGLASFVPGVGPLVAGLNLTSGALGEANPAPAPAPPSPAASAGPTLDAEMAGRMGGVIKVQAGDIYAD